MIGDGVLQRPRNPIGQRLRQLFRPRQTVCHYVGG